MQRGLAGLLLFAAAILLAIAGGGWVLQRVAFNPDVAAASMPTVFESEELRREVATRVAEATAPHIPPTEEQLVPFIEAQFPAMINDFGANAVLTELVRQAHGRVTGSRDQPAQLTGFQMIDIVRYQHVFDLEPVEFSATKVGWLSTTRTVFGWIVPIAAVAGLAAIVLAVVARPSRDDVIFGGGVCCIVGACLVFVLGYLAPGYAIPFLADGDWSAVFPAVADDYLTAVSGAAAALAIVGCLMVFGTTALRRRSSRSWSAPVRPTQYRKEQREWSR